MTATDRLAELDRYAARARAAEAWERDGNGDTDQADAIHHWGAVVRRVADRLRKEKP